MEVSSLSDMVVQEFQEIVALFFLKADNVTGDWVFGQLDHWGEHHSASTHTDG